MKKLLKMKKKTRTPKRKLKFNPTRIVCTAMSISLRGYSLFNCITIQVVMYGEATAWSFSTIIEIASLLIVFLIAHEKTRVGLLIIASFLYVGLSFMIIAINDVSLNFKSKSAEALITNDLYLDYEKIRAERISIISNQQIEPQSNLDENDRLLAGRISQGFRGTLEKRNIQWTEKLNALNGRISVIQDEIPGDVSEVREYIRKWLPTMPKMKDSIKSDMLSIYDEVPLNEAFVQSWGTSPNKAKKRLAFAISLLVELLVFLFAVIPRYLSRKKKKKRKSRKTKKLEADKPLIIDEVKAPVKEPAIKKENQGNKKKVRNSIKSVADLRADMIRFHKLNNRCPNRSRYTEKRRDDYEKIKAELWPKLLEVKK